MPIRGASSGGGGATNLDSLTDVQITTPQNGDLLQYNGVTWLNGSYSHNLLSALNVGDPHPQYLYLPGRAGGQTLLSTAIGDNVLSIKAFAGQTGALLQLLNSGNALLASLVRENNSDGSDIFSLHMVSPSGQNSGALHFWVAGTKGSGKFAQQYYNGSGDTFYTQIVNGSGTKIQFRNFSASGTPRFTLDPTDGGRFGVNTDSPGFTFDVWYSGASVFSVSKTGAIAGISLNTTGNILATGTVTSENAVNINNGGVTGLSLSTDGVTDFLDIARALQVRDTIGGGGTTVASLSKTGKLRLGDGTAAAHRLELVAGTATVAPKRSFAGANLTVQTDGVEEYDGTNFYLSPAAVRQRVTLMPAVRAIASFRI